METTKENSGLLHQILPPRLEDAGLEDPALPPHSIHEAFLKAAAAAVKSRASSFFSDEDDAAPCIDDPWPTASDDLIGIEPEHEPPGACTVEKGCEAVADEVKIIGAAEVGDEVVIGEEGVRLGEDKEPCVDQLQGLGIKEEEEDVKNDVEDENDKKPTLTEGYV